MKLWQASWIFCWLLLWNDANAQAPLQKEATLVRHAFVTGSNQGGKSRPALRFAGSDARAFATVLQDIGGVAKENTVLLIDPSRQQFDHGLKELAKSLESARKSAARHEVLVYYSGHSDEQGLLFRDELYPYEDLRRRLDELPVKVKIAILDSCASGALTRKKGGQRRPSFLMDTSSDTEGQAILTSSSADESSQESDRIGASFFTHYLLTGLRGAADATADGRVTLTEAYQFAFHETLARTEKTRGGAQHANYDIALSGQGDLVMTHIRATDSSLVLSADLSGRVFVRDAQRHLVAELQKYPGRPIELALEPGNYSVTVEDAQNVLVGEMALVVGQQTTLRREALRGAPREHTALRGSTEPTYVDVPFAFTVVPGLSTWYPRGDEKASKRFSFNLFYGRSDKIEGVELGLLNQVHDGVSGLQLGVANIDHGPASGVLVGSVFNITRGKNQGVMLAGSLGFYDGDLTGVSVAGAADVVRGHLHKGVQLGGAVSWISGSLLAGLQAGGALALVGGDLFGLQLGGALAQVRGDMRGMQAAGAVALTHGTVAGFQAAGALNYAGRVDGMQAAVINVTGDVSGTQLGVINIAAGDVNGVQVGVINVARDYAGGFPLGLLNLVKKGQHHVDVWSTGSFASNLSLKLGARNVYSMLSGGYHPGDSSRRSRARAGFGIGGSIPIAQRFFVNLDVSGYHLFYGDGPGGERSLGLSNFAENENLVEARLVGGGSLYEHLGGFIGIAANLHLDYGKAKTPRGGLYGDAKRVFHNRHVSGHAWPTLVAGLQF